MILTKSIKCREEYHGRKFSPKLAHYLPFIKIFLLINRRKIVLGRERGGDVFKEGKLTPPPPVLNQTLLPDRLPSLHESKSQVFNQDKIIS